MVSRRIDKWKFTAIEDQSLIRNHLVQKGQHTAYGKDYGFKTIHSSETFSKAVPMVDYEQIKSYIDRIKGEKMSWLWIA
jgi:hypothetical protein